MKKKNIVYLNEFRQKKKPMTLEEMGKLAAMQYLDPNFLAGIEEPAYLANGNVDANGKFIISDYDAADEDYDLDDINEEDPSDGQK